MSWNLTVPSIVLGEYRLQTDIGTGAVTVAPVAAPPTQTPAPAVQPASITADSVGISLIPSAEFGGRVLHTDLLNILLDLPILSIEGIEMSVRSALGRLFNRVAATEASVVDVSGAIAGVITEQLSNTALDEARAAAQALLDASQSAETAQAALAAATAASDIASIAGRVTALEGAPGFDSTALEARISAAETAIGGKADLTYVDGELAGKAAAADLSTLEGRVTAEETATAAAGSRLDAVEAGVASKVAQADYDVYVAATDAAVAAAASAAASAQSAADAAAGVAAAAEVKGLMSKLIVEEVSTAGISGAYWAETIGQSLADKMDSGKLVSHIYDGPASITIPVGSPAADAVRRLKNGNAETLLTVTMGETYELLAGEVMTFAYIGGAWKLV